MVSAYILTFARILIEIYFMAMIFYILSSWVPPLRESKLGQIVGRIVEPYLGFFRRFIPPLGMIDISPIVAILTYNYLIGNFAFQGLAVILKWVGL